eukprot:TRINITY_DN7657_c0_g2_i1.p2 TRINITY_DN7657_c0_g2~~TRINITY_DN7657_c0_g2_i1.p2  ORF type:complete len:398 (+),score=67.53 TRINITY_DN7657_c0_g2_i1:39-1196(+)
MAAMLPSTIRRIQAWARKPMKPLTIQQLIARTPGVSEEEHVKHAQWCHEELPVRVAHRLNDFLALPYVVVCNNRIHQVFKLFLHSFETLSEYKKFDDIAGADRFATELRSHVRSHSQMIPLMQEGYAELQTLFDSHVDLDAFFNQTFFTRIGNRVLAEHFLGVHEERLRGTAAPDGRLGIVQPDCCLAEMARSVAADLGALCNEVYGMYPELQLLGELDTRLSFVPEHLHFILQEILKNAFRATIENHIRRAPSVSTPLPVVLLEIMKGSFDVTLKISDRGGGMRSEKLAMVWRYGYTSTKEDRARGHDQHSGGELSALCGGDHTARRQIAGYGFGLPLSRVYAQYFGGDIHIQSMYGYGTDVYLNLNHLGNMAEESGGSRLVAC